MPAIAKALKALHDEGEKLQNPKRPVWQMESVAHWSDVKRRARDNGIRAYRFRLFGFVVQKGSELRGGEIGYNGRIVVQGNDGRHEDGYDALLNVLGASPATSEAAKLIDTFGFLEGHDITVADGTQAYTQAELGYTIAGENSGDRVQYVGI